MRRRAGSALHHYCINFRTGYTPEGKVQDGNREPKKIQRAGNLAPGLPGLASGIRSSNFFLRATLTGKALGHWNSF